MRTFIIALLLLFHISVLHCRFPYGIESGYIDANVTVTNGTCEYNGTIIRREKQARLHSPCVKVKRQLKKGTVRITECPFLDPEEYGTGCFLKDGYNGSYPMCCPTVLCPSTANETAS